ncbi:MAG TPA: GPW/gp25 family protein [Chitinophagaceae bacterium]|nr:GPW/gp25 family protein [Chitinophagaceae bacterium]
MITDKTFLGTGWSFPPAFNKPNETVIMVSEEEDVVQSLNILLGTRPGERVMQPRFGCNLDVMLFEPITTTLIAFVKELIENAILYFEPRIELDSININTVEVHDGLILIELNYTIRSTNSRFNFVYPFYLNEGSDVNEMISNNLQLAK